MFLAPAKIMILGWWTVLICEYLILCFPNIKKTSSLCLGRSTIPRIRDPWAGEVGEVADVAQHE